MESPKLVLAPEAVEAPVPPSAMAKSVMPVIVPPLIVAFPVLSVTPDTVPPEIVTLSKSCVERLPRPRVPLIQLAVDPDTTERPIALNGAELTTPDEDA